MNRKQEIEIHPTLKLSAKGTDYVQQCLNDRDYVLQHMTFRMMKAGSKEEWAKDYPLIMWNDIPVVFGVYIELLNELIIINLPLKWASALDLTLEEMERTARLHNAVLYDERLKPIREVIDENEEDCGLYVLFSKRPYGATAIITTDDVARLAKEKGRDIICLPSSRHEWLFYPLTNDVRPEVINESIREVNGNAVPPEDVLSDHAYVYKRESGEYVIWA